MKKIFAIAMLVFSVGAIAQPRKIESQKPQYGQHSQPKGPSYHKHKKDKKWDERGFHKMDFRRLDLSWKQEKELKDILRDKEREVARVKGSQRSAMQQMRSIDKKYDMRIERLLSKSQWRQWNQYYAYQYSSHAAYRV